MARLKPTAHGERQWGVWPPAIRVRAGPVLIVGTASIYAGAVGTDVDDASTVSALTSPSVSPFVVTVRVGTAAPESGRRHKWLNGKQTNGRDVAFRDPEK